MKFKYANGETVKIGSMGTIDVPKGECIYDIMKLGDPHITNNEGKRVKLSEAINKINNSSN